MGTVWVAEQTQPVRRKVALKVIKPGMDSRIVLSRFEQERHALASWITRTLPRYSTRASRAAKPKNSIGGLGKAVFRHGVRQRGAAYRNIATMPS